jgi:ABC-type nitrate/sulfonate/bicarbonate transport system permease component
MIRSVHSARQFDQQASSAAPIAIPTPDPVAGTKRLARLGTRSGRTAGDVSESRWLDLVIAIATIVVVWEVVARLFFVDSTSLSAPSAVAEQMWDDRELLWTNTRSTCLVAIAGFVVGNAVAVVGAAIFVLSGWVERVFSRLALAVYALPTLVLAPVLGMFLDTQSTKIAVSALVVYFPTLVAVGAGLRQPSTGTLDLVRSLGGGRLTALRLVRLRWSMPGLFSGMRVAVPGALLGAIASEWLGADSGLGVFMVNALGYLNTARVWECCVLCIALTGAGYALVGMANKVVNAWQTDRQATR